MSVKEPILDLPVVFAVDSESPAVGVSEGLSQSFYKDLLVKPPCAPLTSLQRLEANAFVPVTDRVPGMA